MSDVVDLDEFRKRVEALRKHLRGEELPIELYRLGDDVVMRETVAYSDENGGLVAVFISPGEGEPDFGAGMTPDQARELGQALIGAAALATKEFRAEVRQREEKDG